MIPVDEKYPGWEKTPRLEKLYMTITEKLDGTNGLIEVGEGYVRAGSRNRWLSLDKDNFGFCRWVKDHEEELLKLGRGRHYGEWWGLGVGRGYNLTEKRFSLFNVMRPVESLPSCVSQVPVLYKGMADRQCIDAAMSYLERGGSAAAPGFMNPEGVIVWIAGQRYKQTFEKGHKGKKDGE